MEALIIVLIFLILLIIGVPIAFTLGISSLITMVFILGTPLTVLPEVLFNNLVPFTLLAIPFFIIAATIMTTGGISRTLVEFAQAWLGHLPGGMATVSVTACAFFSAISGSSVATAMAIGSIVIPAMIKMGYDRKFTLGLIAAGGTLGILIPPSIPMIMFGFIGNVSVGQLFIAAIIPAIITYIFLVGLAIIISVKRGYKVTEKASWNTRWKLTFRSLPALLMPVIILGGIYSGIFTITESSIVAVVYALIIGLFVYRELPFKDVIIEIGKSMKYAGMLMIILATAMVFGHVMTVAQIPQSIVSFVSNADLSAGVFLLIICIILIILGCFMEVTSLLMITTPILVPIVMALGINPIHFGIIFIITMEIGLITPPLGMNLFVVSSVGKSPVIDAIRGATPFTLTLMFILLMVAVFPAFILWLPKVFG